VLIVHKRMVRGRESNEVWHYMSGKDQKCSKPHTVLVDEGERKFQQEVSGRKRNKWGRHSGPWRCFAGGTISAEKL